MSASHSAVARVTALAAEALDGLRADATLATLAPWFEAEDALDAERVALTEELHRLAGPPEGAAREDVRRRHARLQLRRAVFRGGPLPSAGGEDLPAALARRIASYEERLVLHRARESHLVARFAADRTRAERNLIAAMTAPLPAEALRLVSRSLLEKVENLARNPVAPGRTARHVLAKAFAYLARLTTKTSPNGVFCTTARASFDGDRAAVRGTNRPARIEVRLSVGEVRKVTACLAVDPALERLVVPRPNPSLRRTATGWTCWRPASPRDPEDVEIRIEVPDHPVLAAFLAEAEAGNHDVPGLIAASAVRCGLDPASPAVRAFYEKLVDRGLLTAEIGIPWSAPRPLATLASTVRAAGSAPAWLAAIDAIEHAVDGLPALDPAGRRAALDPIEARLESLPHARPLVHDEIFRVDVATGLAITLPAAIADEVEDFARFYARLYAALYPARLFRARTVQRFLARWPADTEVDLLDLDPRIFERTGTPRSPVVFPEPRGGAEPAEWEDARRAFHACREWFARRARETSPRDEIVLASADWDRLAGPDPVPAFSCGVLFQVAATGVEAIDDGRWLAGVNAIYPGGGFAVARLASLHAPRVPGESAWIEEEIARGHRRFERDGAILAEVSFLHGGRTANAGLRPPLLKHEIVLPGDVATPGRTGLPLADLRVRFDSASGELVLSSRSLGVRVVPIVTSGIATEGLLDFLVEIGRQGMQPLAYFPGFDAAGVTHWPRVRSGRVVLFRERWCFAAAGVPGAGARQIDFARFAAIARWRSRHRLPRRVFVHTSADPKPFFVDFEAPLGVEALLRALPQDVRGGEPPVLHVTEMLPGPEDHWVRDDHGRYASEFLLHVAHSPRCDEVEVPEPAAVHRGAR